MNLDDVILDWLHAQRYRAVGPYQHYTICKITDDATYARDIPRAWLSLTTLASAKRISIVVRPRKLQDWLDERPLRDLALNWMLGL